jgi:hypothetical protein
VHWLGLLGHAQLQTGFAVSSLMLTGVDDPASRPDPGSVEARLVHGTAA